jgi:hypothetical protein
VTINHSHLLSRSILHLLISHSFPALCFFIRSGSVLLYFRHTTPSFKTEASFYIRLSIHSTNSSVPRPKSSCISAAVPSTLRSLSCPHPLLSLPLFNRTGNVEVRTLTAKHHVSRDGPVPNTTIGTPNVLEATPMDLLQHQAPLHHLQCLSLRAPQSLQATSLV